MPLCPWLLGCFCVQLASVSLPSCHQFVEWPVLRDDWKYYYHHQFVHITGGGEIWRANQKFETKTPEGKQDFGPSEWLTLPVGIPSACECDVLTVKANTVF